MKRTHCPALGRAFVIVSAIAVVHSIRAGSATWKVDPTNNDWNTAANWTPATVPDDPQDIATLGPSNLTDLQISSGIELASIVFPSDANSYNVTLSSVSQFVDLWGGGVINESGQPQTFVLPDLYLNLIFRNNAAAGDLVRYEITGNNSQISFLENSSAGSATFVLDASFDNSFPAVMYFFDDSTSANASFTINRNSSVAIAGDANSGGSAVFTTSNGGRMYITGGDGGTCTIVNRGAPSSDGSAGHTLVNGGSAGSANITGHGGAAGGAAGATVDFFNSSAGSATILLEGGQVNGAAGASSTFSGRYIATAASATFILTGGTNGGEGASIQFTEASRGGTARLELLGSDAKLDISSHNLAAGLTIGSLEGTGLVILGANKLSVGSNNLSTTFSGLMQGTGSCLKLGAGVLTLSSLNTYTGGTTIEEGTLLVKTGGGSATGTGPVQVNGGTFGGRSNIAGPVMIGKGNGSGAFLAPGVNGPGILAIKNKLFFKADATYNCDLSTTKAKTDQVTAKGVTIEGGARFAFLGKGNQGIPSGTVFIIINNKSSDPISGRFANLPDGSTFTSNGNTFQVDYEGGDENDLTLTVVP